MRIEKKYISPIAQDLLNNNALATKAYSEVKNSILKNVTPGEKNFVLNNSAKHCNGVVPVKEECYRVLEEDYSWYREKPLHYLHDDVKKGGPIDAYKEFSDSVGTFKVGLEFESGNISSAHRAINKLCVGYEKGELDLAMLMLPVKEMASYLTDRVSNYEELEPYFLLLKRYPFIVFGFNAEEYNATVPILPKGTDGMSSRSIRRWPN